MTVLRQACKHMQINPSRIVVIDGRLPQNPGLLTSVHVASLNFHFLESPSGLLYFIG